MDVLLESFAFNMSTILPRRPNQHRWVLQRPDAPALAVWLIPVTLFGFQRLARDWCLDRNYSALPAASPLMARYPCNGTATEQSYHILLHPLQVYRDLLLGSSTTPIWWLKGQYIALISRFVLAVLLPPQMYRMLLPWLLGASRAIAPAALVAVSWFSSSPSLEASSSKVAIDNTVCSTVVPSSLLGNAYVLFSLRWYPLMDVALNLIHPTSVLVEVLYGIFSAACTIVIGLRLAGLAPPCGFKLANQLSKCVSSTTALLVLQVWRKHALRKNTGLYSSGGGASASCSCGGSSTTGTICRVAKCTVIMSNRWRHAGGKIFSAINVGTKEGNNHDTMDGSYGKYAVCTAKATAVLSSCPPTVLRLSGGAQDGTTDDKALDHGEDAAASGGCGSTGSGDSEPGSGNDRLPAAAVPAPRTPPYVAVAPPLPSLAQRLDRRQVLQAAVRDFHHARMQQRTSQQESEYGARHRQMADEEHHARTEQQQQQRAAQFLLADSFISSPVGPSSSPLQSSPSEGQTRTAQRHLPQLLSVSNAAGTTAHEPLPPEIHPSIRQHVPYTTLTTRHRLSFKIAGYRPAHVAPGYQQRVAAVVAAAGLQLERVALRTGCIELTLEARAFGAVPDLAGPPLGPSTQSSSIAASEADDVIATAGGGEDDDCPDQQPAHSPSTAGPSASLTTSPVVNPTPQQQPQPSADPPSDPTTAPATAPSRFESGGRDDTLPERRSLGERVAQRGPRGWEPLPQYSTWTPMLMPAAIATPRTVEGAGVETQAGAGGADCPRAGDDDESAFVDIGAVIRALQLADPATEAGGAAGGETVEGEEGVLEVKGLVAGAAGAAASSLSGLAALPITAAAAVGPEGAMGAQPGTPAPMVQAAGAGGSQTQIGEQGQQQRAEAATKPQVVAMAAEDRVHDSLDPPQPLLLAVYPRVICLTPAEAEAEAVGGAGFTPDPVMSEGMGMRGAEEDCGVEGPGALSFEEMQQEQQQEGEAGGQEGGNEEPDCGARPAGASGDVSLSLMLSWAPPASEAVRTTDMEEPYGPDPVTDSGPALGAFYAAAGGAGPSSASLPPPPQQQLPGTTSTQLLLCCQGCMVAAATLELPGGGDGGAAAGTVTAKLTASSSILAGTAAGLMMGPTPAISTINIERFELPTRISGATSSPGPRHAGGSETSVYGTDAAESTGKYGSEALYGAESLYGMELSPMMLKRLRPGVLLISAWPRSVAAVAAAVADSEINPDPDLAEALAAPYDARTVPVLLVDDSDVAAELQFAIDHWNGTADELDGLLYDLGALVRLQDDIFAASTSAAAAAVRHAACPDPSGESDVDEDALERERDSAIAVANADTDRSFLVASSVPHIPYLIMRAHTLLNHLLTYAGCMGWRRVYDWLLVRQGRATGGVRHVDPPSGRPTSPTSDSDTASDGSSGSGGDGGGSGVESGGGGNGGNKDSDCGGEVKEGSDGGGGDYAHKLPPSGTGSGSRTFSQPGTPSPSPSQLALGQWRRVERNRRSLRCQTLRSAHTFGIVLEQLWVVLGLRKLAAEEAEAYQVFAAAEAAALMNVMQVFDLAALVTVAARGSGSWFVAENAYVVVAAFPGLVLAGAWLLLPRATWRRLSAKSKWARQAAYTFAKFMVAFLGFPQPSATIRFGLSPGMFLVDGVIVPASVLMTPFEAGLVGLVKAPLSARMWYLDGAPYGPLMALVRAVRLAALSVLTTIAVHVHLRLSYKRSRTPAQVNAKAE